MAAINGSFHFWTRAEVQSPLLADELVVASDELPELPADWADTLDSPGPAKYEDRMWAHECFERFFLLVQICI
jgi:hypothetical protein